MSKPAAPLRIPPGAKRTPLAVKPFDGLRQVVDPQTDVIERRGMHGGFLVGVDRLHQIDFDLERALAHRDDVFIDVFAFADEVAGDFEAEHVNPELTQFHLVGAADGDLLDTEDFEGTLDS
jgi:hypothetical protein